MRLFRPCLASTDNSISAMFRCVVPLDLVQDTPRLLGWECLVQGPHSMSVQIITDKHNLLGLWEILVHPGQTHLN